MNGVACNHVGVVRSGSPGLCRALSTLLMKFVPLTLISCLSFSSVASHSHCLRPSLALLLFLHVCGKTAQQAWTPWLGYCSILGMQCCLKNTPTVTTLSPTCCHSSRCLWVAVLLVVGACGVHADLTGKPVPAVSVFRGLKNDMAGWFGCCPGDVWSSCELLPVRLDHQGLLPSDLDALMTARHAAGLSLPKVLYIIPTGEISQHPEAQTQLCK